MRYSLTSRVKGALFGGLIGQNLALKEAEEPLIWSQGVVDGILDLLKSRGEFALDKSDQHRTQVENLEILNKTTNQTPNNLNFADAILSTLPIAIFFHENDIKLRQNLLLATKNYHHPDIRDGVLAVCYLIAQSLNEKINQKIIENTLVSEIISFIGENSTYLPKKIQQVNNLIVDNIGLTELKNYLGKENNISNTIAIAFYCFANTKEDFRLTCLQAAKSEYNSQACGAIAGVISGAYNSMAGIPITWHLGLDEAKLAQWGIPSFSQMVKLADALVAVWSGVYHVLPNLEIKEANTNLISPSEAIAAPYIIRLR